MSDCLFCKIINKEINADIVYEDNEILAFRDISPQAPVHVLVIPKKHIGSVNGLEETDDGLVGRIYRVIQKIAKNESCSESGYRVVVNTGTDAGQAVEHIHFHLLAKRKLAWPPG